MCQNSSKGKWLCKRLVNSVAFEFPPARAMESDLSLSNPRSSHPIYNQNAGEKHLICSIVKYSHLLDDFSRSV